MRTQRDARLVPLVAVLLLAFGMPGSIPAQQPDSPTSEVSEAEKISPAPLAERMRGLCTRVVSGDRIDVETRSGGTMKIRYLGVRLPAPDDPNPALRLLNKKAFAFNRKLVDNQPVRLEFESREPDQTGRLAAYVFAGDTFVNVELIRQGYARIAEADFQMKRYFRKKEELAFQQGLGIWGVQPEPNVQPADQPPPPLPPPSLEGKYVASARSKVFHNSDCEWAKRIAPENLVVFDSREVALASGRRPCKICAP